MSARVTQMLEALRSCSTGMTAKEIAPLLGWNPLKASFVMGRMFFAGLLDRRGGVGPARRNNEFVYSIKVAAEREPLRLITDDIRIAALASDADRFAELEAL